MGNSNMRHRPIGIGVQGLADALVKLRLPYEGDAARQLNKDIFETIYYGAMEASIQLAKEEGTYETYEGSPTSGTSRPRRAGTGRNSAKTSPSTAAATRYS